MNFPRDKFLPLAILAIIVFYPLVFVGFTTNDDAVLEIIVRQVGGGLFGAAHAAAAALGRFMVLVSYPITQVPYIFDNQAWHFGTKVFGFVLLFGSVFWASVRLFKDSLFAALILVLILSIMQNGWNHDLYTSYPLIFHFYAACFFSSVALFVSAIETQSVLKAWISSALYFISMGTEIFIGFSFVYPLLMFALPGTETGGLILTLRSRFRILLPMTIGLVLYLMIYLAWRNYYSIYYSYSGNSFDGSSGWGFSKVVYYYGINGFPILSFQNLDSKFINIFRQSPFLLPIILIKATISTSLVLNFVRNPRLTPMSLAFLNRSAILMIVSMFLVNVLLGFTSKYQAWVLNGSRSFTYTFYSMVFAAIASAIVLALVSRASFMYGVVARRVVLASIGCLVFLVTLVVAINNQFVFNDQALSERKWKLFDAVMWSAEFKAIPDHAVIYSPSLPTHQRGIAQALGPYWQAYVSAKLGKDVEFRTDACHPDRPCYSLSFTQDIYRDEQYMVLAQVEPAARETAKAFTLFAVPQMGGRILNGFFFDTKGRNPLFRLNDIDVKGHASDTMFSVRIPDERGTVSKVGVNSDALIRLSQINVSLGDQPLPVFPVQFHLSKGFYSREGSDSEGWSWASDSAELKIDNLLSSPVHAFLSGEINSIHSEDNLSSSVDGRDLWSGGVNSGTWTKFTIPLDLHTGNTTLIIKADRTAIPPSASDSRALSFRIRNVALEVERNGGGK